MRTKILALLLVLGTSAAAYGFQAAGAWVKYTSTEGRYNALLPKEPKLSSQEASGPDGGKYTQYMAMSTDATGLFMISYFDYGQDVIFSLDKARDGMINAVNGTLLSEDVISLGGHPGRQVKVLAKLGNGQEVVTRARFYMVERRVYVLQHMFLKSSESASIADKTTKFFDSFKVAMPR